MLLPLNKSQCFTVIKCTFWWKHYYWLIFSIPAVIAPIFNPTAELTIPMGILTKETKAEIETHPLTVEAKVSSYSISFKGVQRILSSLIINSF